ncbi:hypothetical protein HKX48_007006 [Thoreauomyces humboldtii]|nr:hypothetical protein HKX48_007006 [Thoreauomyces humboldtii]
MVRPSLFVSALITVLGARSISAYSSHASTGDVSVAHKCPIAEKCPYYASSKEATEKDGKHYTGCPLKDGKCPYFDQHKKDHTVEESLVSADHKCPLAEKCKWYKDIKDGNASDVDFSQTNCPLAGKCPYYTDVKEKGEKGASDCPVLHACPHFTKKDLDTQPHPHGNAHGHGHDAAKCPHMRAQQAAVGHGHSEEL